MIDLRNILARELIGLDVLVADASNPSYRGLSGCIVDETKNMLAIETTSGIKRIPKPHSIFRFNIKGNRVVEIDGSVFTLAPEKRISLH
ncbi:MAG: Ribonuclease P protein component 1 [Methanoregula sp. PtaU1.Bin051]|nr:MAG: Ribonuclease P protein component 1 [Methanoregula sp. PtaU1.Bin051]